MKNNKRDIIIIMIIGIVIIVSVVFCILIFKNMETSEVASENDSVVIENNAESSKTEEPINIGENIIETEAIASNENEAIPQENNIQPTQTNNNQTNKPSNNNNSSSSSTNNTNSSGTPSVPSTPTQTPTTPTEPSTPTPVQEKCTNNNNHYTQAGNCGKWYATEADGVTDFNNLRAYWGPLWENGEIDTLTYNKNCPYRHEQWTCLGCGKWTFNYFYRQ